MNKTFRYTYKVVLQNGSLADKVYYGQHTTKNLYDGYRGSGRVVKDYYKKYPERSSSIVYIQKFYDTKEELDQAEKELIEPHLGKDYCLNIARGGDGGDLFRGHYHTTETREKMSVAIKASMTSKVRAKISATHKGRKRTDETKLKMSASATKKPIKILNLITNEILTFERIKDCVEYLQVDVRGVFRRKFLNGIPTPNQPILKNWKIIN